MIRIGILGDIGSGKSYVAKLFGYPVFNADKEVANIYRERKSVFIKLKKQLPNYFSKFPVDKKELIKAILDKKKNIKKISLIVHPLVRKNLSSFLKKNYKKKIVILDIPLYLENKLNKKNDIIIFIQSKKKHRLKKIKSRKNFNKLIIQRLKSNQMPLVKKKKISHYVIKNDFNKNTARKNVKDILNKILK